MINGKVDSIILGKSPKYQTPPSDGLPNIRWDVDRFERLIYQQGYDVLIDRAHVCPCRDKVSGQALSTCKNCFGRGWFFVDRRETRIVAQSLVDKRDNRNWTSIDNGEAKFTARAVDDLNYMDRIILTELRSRRTELLRPHNDIYNDLIVYPVYEPIEIDNMFLFVGDNVKLMPLTDKQYEIDGNLIRFDKKLLKNAPVSDINQTTPDLTISMMYTYKPVYHVMNTNRDLMRVHAAGTGSGGATFCSNENQNALKSMPINLIGKKAHFMFGLQEWGEHLYDNTI
jgi:hypothetical protein